MLNVYPMPLTVSWQIFQYTERCISVNRYPMSAIEGRSYHLVIGGRLLTYW